MIKVSPLNAAMFHLRTARVGEFDAMTLQNDVETRIREALPDSEVRVSVEGNRALIQVTSDGFANLNRVRRHQAVYACIQNFIADGSLHAVTIDAATPDERD